MFDGIKKWIDKVVRKMIPVKDIGAAIGQEPAISSQMIKCISEWDKMLKGEADWIDHDAIHSLRLESGIVSEFVNIALNEMDTKVSNDKLNELYQAVLETLNENLQSGLALGSMIIKPLGGNAFQYVTADSFVPVEFDSKGRLIKVVFLDTKPINDTKCYRRLEYHSLDKDGLTITNTAYECNDRNSLGTEVSLKVVEEWKGLPPYINYPLMNRPDFGYYRNPIKNDIDGSFCGVSIFDSAKQLIKQADIQYGRLLWEFESGERAIHTSIEAIKKNLADDGQIVEGVAKLNKRLYRGLNIESKDKQFFDDFTPEFRDENIINGLCYHERKIEFNVGLAYGDISDPSVIEKTATEVIVAKKRKYNMVTAIQKNLKDCLEDMVYALAFYNGLTQTGYEFICNFKDSILVDEETERKEDRQDLAAGIMRPEEYRAKWYGETEEQAAERLPSPALTEE